MLDHVQHGTSHLWCSICRVPQLLINSKRCFVTHFLKLLKFTANPANPADPADRTEIKQAYPDLKIYEGLQKPGEAQSVLGAGCFSGGSGTTGGPKSPKSCSQLFGAESWVMWWCGWISKRNESCAAAEYAEKMCLATQVSPCRMQVKLLHDSWVRVIRGNRNKEKQLDNWFIIRFLYINKCFWPELETYYCNIYIYIRVYIY